jgi:hypothetical protein
MAQDRKGCKRLAREAKKSSGGSVGVPEAIEALETLSYSATQERLISFDLLTLSQALYSPTTLQYARRERRCAIATLQPRAQGMLLFLY